MPELPTQSMGLQMSLNVSDKQKSDQPSDQETGSPEKLRRHWKTNPEADTPTMKLPPGSGA